MNGTKGRASAAATSFGDERAELERAAIAVDPLLSPAQQSSLEHLYPTDSPLRLFAAIARWAPRASKVNASYRFRLSGRLGGTWFVDLREGFAAVRRSDEAAQCTVAMDVMDLLSLAAGRLDARSAFSMGKMKVAGDMGLAMKLDTLFALMRQAPRP